MYLNQRHVISRRNRPKLTEMQLTRVLRLYKSSGDNDKKYKLRRAELQRFIPYLGDWFPRNDFDDAVVDEKLVFFLENKLNINIELTDYRLTEQQMEKALQQYKSSEGNEKKYQISQPELERFYPYFGEWLPRKEYPRVDDKLVSFLEDKLKIKIKVTEPEQNTVDNAPGEASASTTAANSYNISVQ